MLLLDLLFAIGKKIKANNLLSEAYNFPCLFKY